MRPTILTLLVALTLGCSTTPASTGELRDRDWSLVWVEGFDSLPSGAATPTIRFGSDGRLGGNTGCNSAGANYTAEGNRLTIEALISTKRACLDPQGNALERAYIQAVEATRSYRIADGQLELLDAGDQVVARFTLSS
ncbi:MAG TPA: META domain-containing protein [Thermoanaerobaculia bacterium]|nr:META domain-containing protein [Thermoanaerobaculia bacterium]